MEGERFLTPAEAGEFLGASDKVMTKWAREGKIPAYPLGEGSRRMWRFRKSDLEQWLVNRRAEREAK